MQQPDKLKMAKNLHLYMDALKQLDSLSADSRALNHFRIQLIKQYPEREVITANEFNVMASKNFKQENMIVDIIRASTSNQDESEISLSKINDLINLFHYYPVLKKGDKNNS